MTKAKELIKYEPGAFYVGTNFHIDAVVMKLASTKVSEAFNDVPPGVDVWDLPVMPPFQEGLATDYDQNEAVKAVSLQHLRFRRRKIVVTVWECEG